MATIFLIEGCTVQKKKGEVGTIGKIYHNTTAKFNGYFNADVLMQEAEATLAAQYQENYNQLLPIYPYTETNDAKSVSANLDKAIEKVSIAATIHEPSQWVDDCYVLLGKAQYLKQDYETAEKTFEFFVDEFDPLNKRKSKLKDTKKEKKKTTRKSTRRPTTKKKKTATKKRDTAKKKTKKKKTKKAGTKKRTSKPGSKKRPEKTTTEKESTTPESSTATESSAETVTPKETESTSSSTRTTESKKTNPPNSDPKEVVSSAEKNEMFGHKPVYQEGILWLARTYVHRERFSLATYYLDKVEGDAASPENVKQEIPVVRAFLHIKKKEYGEAIESLDQAITLSKNKEDKARFTFIIAQLNQLLGRQDKAFDAYNEVIKMHPSYEMEFNAALNLSKAAWASGQETAETTMKRLEKMGKEEKNFEYRDQIYYTMGTINLKLKQRDLAIENFRQSIKYNVGNGSQSAESYYALATYFYDEEDYADAKYHYDSTLITLPKTDERYDDVKNKSENLKDIATNISTIELQDSLLRVSEMGPDEQKKIAAALKKQKELASKPKTAILSKGANVGNTFSVSNGGGGSATGAKSDYFAYDINKLRRGQNDFRKKWGSRTLEDDWRRSNKTSSSISSESSEEQIAKRMTDEEVKELLSGVPFSAKDKLLANNRIEEAYFNLGKLYRSKLEQFMKSAESLEELYRRNEKTTLREEAYYYSYLSYLDLKNTTKANYYRDKLVSDFPDSKYTLSITDPSYGDKQLNEAKKVERKYDQAYSLFEEGEYASAKSLLVALANEDKEKLKGLNAKIDLLTAMCVANLEGEDAYITSLNYVVKKHPNTPEEARAKEILRFVKGDKKAFDPILYNESGEDFIVEPDKLHYVIAILYSKSSKDMTTSKIDISTFNQKNFKDDKLKISSIYLNKEDGSQIILVRKFSNQDAAMKYHQKAIEAEEEFISEDLEYEIFAVTQKSYREIVKQRSSKAYRPFFDANY